MNTAVRVLMAVAMWAVAWIVVVVRPELNLDTLEYIKMIQHQPAMPPFSHRILVPFLASLIPVQPAPALSIITYVSLVGMYIILLAALARAGYGPIAGAAALLCLLATPCHMLAYRNPRLTDGFGLLAMAVMFGSLLARRAAPFGLAAVLGVLGREATVFLVPAVVVLKRWGAVVIVLLAAFASWLGPYLLIGGGLGTQGFFFPTRWQYFAEAYLSYGYLWLPLFAGLLLAPEESALTVRVSFLCLFAGALLSSCRAADTARMFAIIIPAGTFCLAAYFSALWRRSRPLTVAALLIPVLSIPFTVPTRILPVSGQSLLVMDDFCMHFRYPIAALQLAGLAVNVAGLALLRHELANRWRMVINRRASLGR